MGADDPPHDDEDFSIHLRAKQAADEAARAANIMQRSCVGVIRPTTVLPSSTP